MLTRLEAFEGGNNLRVRLRSGQAADPTGQLLLAFSEPSGGQAEGRRPPIVLNLVHRRDERSSDSLSAEAWFGGRYHG